MGRRALALLLALALCAPAMGAQSVFDLPVGLVVVDPGHGGSDPGAVGNQVVEKDLALRVALRLRDELARHGVQVLMTRSDDRRLSLEERCRIANSAVWPEGRGAVFVSIHANSAAQAEARGFEVFYTPKEGRGAFLTEDTPAEMGFRFASLDREEAAAQVAGASARLAASVLEAMERGLGLTSRGVKTERFYVTRNAFMPSILVELGFLSNSDEAREMASDQFAKRAAEAVCAGILGL